MTKDAIEHRLDLVADMLRSAVDEITDVLSTLEKTRAESAGERSDGDDGNKTG